VGAAEFFHYVFLPIINEFHREDLNGETLRSRPTGKLHLSTETQIRAARARKYSWGSPDLVKDRKYAWFFPQILIPEPSGDPRLTGNILR
jgi:hypothetical protein